MISEQYYVRFSKKLLRSENKERLKIHCNYDNYFIILYQRSFVQYFVLCKKKMTLPVLLQCARFLQYCRVS